MLGSRIWTVSSPCPPTSMVALTHGTDAAAEQRDPDSFDPTVNLRGMSIDDGKKFASSRSDSDYDAIDLPVFTCSARDYVRIKGD